MAIARVYLIAVSFHLDGYNCRFFYNLLRVVFVTRISPLSMNARYSERDIRRVRGLASLRDDLLSFSPIEKSPSLGPSSSVRLFRVAGKSSFGLTKIGRIDGNAFAFLSSLARVSI